MDTCSKICIKFESTNSRENLTRDRTNGNGMLSCIYIFFISLIRDGAIPGARWDCDTVFRRRETNHCPAYRTKVSHTSEIIHETKGHQGVRSVMVAHNAKVSTRRGISFFFLYWAVPRHKYNTKDGDRLSFFS